MRKLAVLALIAALMVPLCASDFIMDYYAVRITVDDSRSMNIKENYTIEFPEPVHGFIRDIQYRFSDGTNADFELLWASDSVTLEDNGAFYSIRFGSADRFISGGPYAYGIKYNFSLGADRYQDYDEFYYNIVSPEVWNTDIARLAFSVTLPYPVDPERIWLTAGPYGSDADIPFTISEDGCTVSGRYSDLPAGYGVTLRIEMDDGYFDTAVIPFNYARLGLALSLLFSILMVAGTVIIWFVKGRDETLAVPPQFTPPAGLSPLDAGYVANGEIENSAVSSMLIYWADKGYITITDRGGDDFSFQKVSELPEEASAAEHQLFAAFFPSGSSSDAGMLRASGFPARLSAVKKAERERFTGDMDLTSPDSRKLRAFVMNLLILPVILHSFSSTLAMPGFLSVFVLIPSLMAYMMLRSVSSSVEKRIRSHGLKFSYIMSPVFFILFIWFFIVSALQGVPYALIDTTVFMIALFISVLAAAFIDRRSAYADKVLTEVMGYREFIEKVEKDRIEKLSAEDPQFFYHVLSYAMALGVDDKWTKAFSGIYVEPARWYYGPDGTDFFMISAFSRRWGRVYSSSVAPRRSGSGMRTTRGSSGFSGGGFSGGGGRTW